MKALLLAAGFGSRLRPITNTVPKCLVPILGKPLLEIWLDRLLQSGHFERILINTHYLSEVVVDFIENYKWRSKVDLIYEPVLLGTAGTLLKNSTWIGKDSLLVAHADNLTLFDIDSFILVHEKRPTNCPITMMTFNTDAPNTCGIVELSEGVVVRFHEKVENPPGLLANAAVYLLEPEVVFEMNKMNREIIDFSTDIIPKYLGRMVTYHNDIYHRDIGNLNSLSLAEIELKKMGISSL